MHSGKYALFLRYINVSMESGILCVNLFSFLQLFSRVICHPNNREVYDRADQHREYQILGEGVGEGIQFGWWLMST